MNAVDFQAFMRKQTRYNAWRGGTFTVTYLLHDPISMQASDTPRTQLALNNALDGILTS